MPEQVSKIYIDSEIIPNKGIGEILLGMNCMYLRDVYMDNFKGEDGSWGDMNDKGYWSHELGKPFWDNLILSYRGFMTIYIDLFTGNISAISVKNVFKGKLFNITGIGDTTREFYKQAKSLGCEFCEFNEGGFFFWVEEKKCGLLLTVAEYDKNYFPESSEEFQKFLDVPIKEIWIDKRN